MTLNSKRYCFFISLFLLLTVTLSAQDPRRLLQDGNAAFEEKDYATAEEFYRKSMEKDETGKAVYNLGNALYAQGRYEEAVPKFADASRIAPNKNAKASSFHNLGNAQFQAGELEEAIAAYKEALRLNPHDNDTKYNLARAQRQQRQQKEQQQKQEQQEKEQNDQEKNEENQDQQEQQENQEQQEQNSEEQSEENQQQPSENQQQQDDAQQPQAGEAQQMSREEAMKLLQIMEQEEQNVQKKMQFRNVKPNKSDKDW